MTRRSFLRRLLGQAQPCPRWPCCTRPVTCTAGERIQAARLADRYSVAVLRVALELGEELANR